MLMNEFLKRQESIYQKMQRTLQPTLAVQQTIQRMHAPIIAAERLQAQINAFSAIPSSLREIPRLQQESLLMMTQLPYDSLMRAAQSFDRLSAAISASANVANLLANSTANRIISSVSIAIAAAQPYIPAEQYEEYAETIEPVLNQEVGTRLSLGVCLSLIGLLFNILFGIVSNLPDAQLDRIIQQNDIIIEQQQEMIELENEDVELRDALNALTDSIDLLSDEIDSLREEIENSNDLAESDGQPDTEDGNQQNGDA